MTPALAEIMTEIDGANRLAARAAMGDREALREYVETDPALGGLDRLYCLDVVKAADPDASGYAAACAGGIEEDGPPHGGRFRFPEEKAKGA